MVDTSNKCDDLANVFHSWHGLKGATSPLNGGSNLSHASPLLPAFRRQGSIQGRKTLPNVPDMETQLSLSAKMIDRRTCTPRGNHSYGPFFLEYTLLAEYNVLQKQKMPGVYVIPSEHSSLVWNGVIFIRQGIYQEGIFRFKLFIPDNFPDGDCPRLIFDDFVFHPMIDPITNEMDIQQRFNMKWKRNVNHIWQILLYARRCFYKIETKEPLNLEAADLYNRESLDRNSDDTNVTFRSRVRDCVMKWRDKIYENPNSNDTHFLVFSPFDPKIHESIRQSLLTPTSSTTSSAQSSLNYSIVDSSQASRVDQLSNSGNNSFLESASLRVFQKFKEC